MMKNGDAGIFPVYYSLNFPNFFWFQDFNVAIHKMPPLAFGLHNGQYDCDMVII